MGEVSARQHGRRDRALEGPRPAARADRAGDPDGLRRHRQAPVPGRLRAHRGRHGRDVEDLVAIRDIGPKVAESRRTRSSRAPEVREEIAELRAPRRRARRAGRGPPGRRRRGGRLAAEGQDRRRHRRLHARRHRAPRSAGPDLTRLVEQAGATAASSVSSNTDYLLAGANVGAAKTDKARSSASRSSTRTRSGPGCGRPGCSRRSDRCTSCPGSRSRWRSTALTWRTFRPPSRRFEVAQVRRGMFRLSPPTRRTEASRALPWPRRWSSSAGAWRGIRSAWYATQYGR